MKQPSEIEAWDYYISEAPDYWDDELSYNFDMYVKFLKQSPHPSMFVPWDDENNCPMEEPDITKGWTVKEGYVNKYQQALKRVVYEGFKYWRSEGTHHFKSNEITMYKEDELKTFRTPHGRMIRTLADLKGLELRDEWAKKLNLKTD